MIIRLQHQRSDGDVDTYHLKSGRRYHIGRGSACEVRILDLKLSRKHCAVEYSEGEWRVIDLASTNGCKVDGDQIVGSVPLTVGTQIDIGQTAIKVVRILGEDEANDEAEAEASDGKAPRPAPAARMPTPAPIDHPTPAPDENGAHEGTDRHVEQEEFPADGKVASPVEHAADDWEPEPEPEAAVKTGALVPNAEADAAADQALESARRAAMQTARPGSAGTGEIQNPGRLRTPVAQLRTPRPELPAAKPPADGTSSQYRKTPLARQPSPLPMPAAEIESGPHQSLDPQPPARAAAARAEIKPVAPKPPLEIDEPAPTAATADTSATKQPGTETRRRQKIMPVIVQAMSDDEVSGVDAQTLPTSMPLHAAPAPVAAPKPIAPPPMEPLEKPRPPEPAAADERTFYITVLGRRVGPLTRAAARDLKARELKGTLTLKDLEQFS